MTNVTAPSFHCYIGLPGLVGPNVTAIKVHVQTPGKKLVKSTHVTDVTGGSNVTDVTGGFKRESSRIPPARTSMPEATNPNSSLSDNYGSYGNTNPYTVSRSRRGSSIFGN